jgi:hypothetical protein
MITSPKYFFPASIFGQSVKSNQIEIIGVNCSKFDDKQLITPQIGKPIDWDFDISSQVIAEQSLCQGFPYHHKSL